MATTGMCDAIAAVIRKHVRTEIGQDWDGMTHTLAGIEGAAQEIVQLINTADARPWGKHGMVIEPQEDGTWLATVPDFPGCIATADTPDQALERLRDVQESWIAACESRGIAIPEPRWGMALSAPADAIRTFLGTIDQQGLADAISSYDLIRNHDGWRLYHRGRRVDGPWSDSDEDLAYEALGAAQASAVVAWLGGHLG